MKINRILLWEKGIAGMKCAKCGKYLIYNHITKDDEKDNE